MTFSKPGLGLSGAVGVVIVAAVMGRVGTDPSGAVTTPGRRATAPPASRANLAVDDIRLELLQQERSAGESAARNPFRFDARETTPGLPGGPAAAGPAPAAPAVIVPAGPPPLPPIPLRFIGLVDAPTQAGRLAILSDGRGNIFYGRDGAIIEGRYKVLTVSPEAAELSYLDGRGRQTIRLTGQ